MIRLKTNMEELHFTQQLFTMDVNIFDCAIKSTFALIPPPSPLYINFQHDHWPIYFKCILLFKNPKYFYNNSTFFIMTKYTLYYSIKIYWKGTEIRRQFHEREKLCANSYGNLTNFFPLMLLNDAAIFE